MKTLKFAAMTLLAAVIFVGCAKTEKFLPKKDGRWNGTEVTTVVKDSAGTQLSSTTTTDSLGYSVFEKDGTGESFDFDGTSDGTFTWSVNDDDTQITLTMDPDSVTYDPMVYDIIVSEKKHQEWFFSMEIDLGPFGGKQTWETTMKMDRAE